MPTPRAPAGHAGKHRFRQRPGSRPDAKATATSHTRPASPNTPESRRCRTPPTAPLAAREREGTARAPERRGHRPRAAAAAKADPIPRRRASRGAGRPGPATDRRKFRSRRKPAPQTASAAPSATPRSRPGSVAQPMKRQEHQRQPEGHQQLNVCACATRTNGQNVKPSPRPARRRSSPSDVARAPTCR